jgi:hypothetical protein
LSSDLQARNPNADASGTVFNCVQHLQKTQKIKLEVISHGEKTTTQISLNYIQGIQRFD